MCLVKNVANLWKTVNECDCLDQLASMAVFQLVLTLTLCASIAVISDGAVTAAARRPIHDDDQYTWPGDVAAAIHACKPTTNDAVAPALCGVCDYMPDHLAPDCCRWCFTEKTYLQVDGDNEPGTLSFFLSILNPTFSIHHLFPFPRPNSVTSKLRSY